MPAAIYIFLLLWINNLSLICSEGLVPERDVDIEYIKTAPFIPYIDGDTRARKVENNNISSYQYSLDYVQIFFTKNNTRYCLKDNFDPFDPQKTADKFPYAVIEECKNQTDSQRWHFNGTQYARFEVGKENPYIGATWWKGLISNLLTRRCIYAKQYSPSENRFPPSRTQDGYQALGMLHLADCGDSKFSKEGIGQIEIDPYDTKSNEFIYPVGPMAYCPLGSIASSTYNCPLNTTGTLLVPETRSFRRSNTTITPALWGCTPWDFGVSSHVANTDVSPIGNWVEHVKFQEQCLCDQQEIYPISICQYKRNQVLFDHWRLCDKILKTVNVEFLDGLLGCKGFNDGEQPPALTVPVLDPKVCDEAWSSLGFPSVDGVKPCADLAPDFKDTVDCATVSPVPTALT
ncbi:hypothetical protein ABW21_db0200711 [Orbilia brochopaga]|nr:hypothetical protein ABW21_db0200711 [Drechslerella brochopaga]